MELKQAILILLIIFAFITAHSQQAVTVNSCEISEGLVHGRETIIITGGNLNQCLEAISKALSRKTVPVDIVILMDGILLADGKSLEEIVRKTTGPKEFIYSDYFLNSPAFAVQAEKNNIEFKINSRNIYSNKKAGNKISVNLVDKNTMLQIY